MSRPPEPMEVKLYRQWLKEGPPVCCHTCDLYMGDGVCDKHKMSPPAEFAATMGACPDWIGEIPF